MNTMQNTSYKNRGLLKNPYDVFGIGRGHRTYNHDIVTGGLLGMVQARKMGLPPSHGLIAQFSHQATDALSNKMVQTMGVEGRNIFEAVMGLNAKRSFPKSSRRFNRNSYNAYYPMF